MIVRASVVDGNVDVVKVENFDLELEVLYALLLDDLKSENMKNDILDFEKSLATFNSNGYFVSSDGKTTLNFSKEVPFAEYHSSHLYTTDIFIKPTKDKP
ncbi:hypothetical protein ACFC9N_11270 [Enterococcus casseliflavus]|uniref:hypothetical protein n=1 Tax=Enterococcus casseliflavus TaxID=37734 RepID=UPI0039A67E1D